MIISQVVAVSKNRAIGAKGRLPWRLADDAKYFVDVTTGHPVIMGSRTYESISERYRPLSNRTNIVLTRNPDKTYEGAETVPTLGEAFKFASDKPGSEEIMIVGGGSVYEQVMPLTQRIYLTEVDTVIEDADTFYPELDPVRWTRKEVGRFEKDEKNEFSGTYYIYERTGNYPVVEPINGRNEEYRNQLKGILETGVCPFCPNGETLREQEILKTTDHWFVKFNHHPLQGSAYHFMITPHRHITAAEDITADEWIDFTEVRKWLKANYAMTGDAMYVRSGEPLTNGATVSHLHYHIIVPAPFVQVSFGLFPGTENR